MIGCSCRWESAWNSHGALSCFFAKQNTAELDEVAVCQCCLSRKVATINTCVVLMIKTGNGKKRDNAFNGDYFHVL